jgi:hypothetical protein
MKPLLFLLFAASAAARCTSEDVKRINKCLYSLDKPHASDTKEEKCNYVVTYFRCFSGGCCKDVKFQKTVEFIKNDIEALNCGTPVQCASASATRFPMLVVLLSSILAATLL